MCVIAIRVVFQDYATCSQDLIKASTKTHTEKGRHTELAIGSFNVLGRCRARDAQDVVIVWLQVGILVHGETKDDLTFVTGRQSGYDGKAKFRDFGGVSTTTRLFPRGDCKKFQAKQEY